MSRLLGICLTACDTASQWFSHISYHSWFKCVQGDEIFGILTKISIDFFNWSWMVIHACNCGRGIRWGRGITKSNEEMCEKPNRNYCECTLSESLHLRSNMYDSLRCNRQYITTHNQWKCSGTPKCANSWIIEIWSNISTI